MGIFDDENNGNPSLFGTDDDVYRIMSDFTQPKQTRDLATQVHGMEDRVRKAGLDPSLTEPRPSFFGELLDTLDAPRQGVAGILDTLVRGDMFTKDANGDDVGFGFRRGQQENTTTSDILDRLGFNPGIGRGIAGLAGDIITDPLSWITLGTGAGARVGGKVLAEEGAQLSKTLSERLMGNGVTDLIAHDSAKDDIFKAISTYQDEAKLAHSTTSEAAKALHLDQMSKAESVFSPHVSVDEIAGKQLFETNKLRVGLNLPFLGHLTGDAAITGEELAKDIGPVGQALRLAGKAFKPGKIDLGAYEFSDDTIKAFDNIKAYANEGLSKIVEAIEPVPVLGALSKKATDIVSSANDIFKKTFYQKALVGAAANNNRLDFLNVRAANKARAVQEVLSTFKPEELANKSLMKDVYMDIDSLAMQAAKETLPEDDGVVKALNRFMSTGEVLDSDHAVLDEALKGAGSDNQFRSHLNDYLANPQVPPDRKELVQRTIGAMDSLSSLEAEKGVNYNFLSYYVPHRYKNIGQMEGKVAGKSANFAEKRTFANVGDAFAQRGLVADDELPELLRYRFQKGFDNIAQRQYAQRLMVEEGLNPKLLTNLYKEAVQEPKGAAAQALARYRVQLKPLDAEMLADGRSAQLYQEAFGKAAKGDAEAGRIVADGAAAYTQKVREELLSSGQKPLDNWLPDAALGEIGEKVTHNGEQLILPKPIADSMKETIAARDILKDTLGSTPFGKATIGALDHASSFFKKMVTLPWPGYWVQNFIGDRFNQALQGIHAYDPGIFARTHSVLGGKSAVISKNGLRLDKTALERVIKEMGLSFSVGDMIGAVESFSQSNIDKALLAQKGVLKNALSLSPQKWGAALSKNQDNFQKAFDSFFRVGHFVHRFEKGDTVADAVRASQEAYYNYRDMSPVESSLFRRFYMFYGYMSKATKQTMTSLVSAPGNLTMQLHGTNALAELFMDPEGAPTLEKHEMRLLNSQVNAEQLSKVVGRAPDGTPLTARGFAAPLNAVMQQFSVQVPRSFSVGEFVDTFSDSALRTVQKQFAMSNPAINAPLQLISGKNLYFDKPLDAEFLRKLPSLNAAAEKLAGFKHDELPFDLDAATKSFLKAVPDGKGRLIADPSRMWILVNLVPGMGRAVSTTGAFTNDDIPTGKAALRGLTGISVNSQEPSRTYLYQRKNELEKFISANSVNQRLKNQESGEE
jgi:hypothetical protein